MDAIKQRFVQGVLQEQGNRLLRNQGNALYHRLKFHTGHLVSQRSVQVTGGEAMDGKLIFRHLDYERFLDMKKSVMTKKGKTKRTTGYRIHNRFIYGHYMAIARQLSVGFTEQVRDSITQELKSKING